MSDATSGYCMHILGIRAKEDLKHERIENILNIVEMNTSADCCQLRSIHLLLSHPTGVEVGDV